MSPLLSKLMVTYMRQSVREKLIFSRFFYVLKEGDYLKKRLNDHS
ncbi:hypothetical protein JOC86_003014 [Bacillus pakistanensis]|uniref:Uncharacterized protein n=1 Tax=Rossellomorea pakistanensis TaxID=992288 RepID=A0ABS2NF44_9BACI|nr:hypothetical protein [Bacillus pakistanensis]